MVDHHQSGRHASGAWHKVAADDSSAATERIVREACWPRSADAPT